jgi:hypothetical protein
VLLLQQHLALLLLRGREQHGFDGWNEAQGARAGAKGELFVLWCLVCFVRSAPGARSPGWGERYWRMKNVANERGRARLRSNEEGEEEARRSRVDEDALLVVVVRRLDRVWC